MTVRELIEYLKTLDQDKGIWVEYDSYMVFPPTPDATFLSHDIDEQNERLGVKEGDYKIIAG